MKLLFKEKNKYWMLTKGITLNIAITTELVSAFE